LTNFGQQIAIAGTLVGQTPAQGALCHEVIGGYLREARGRRQVSQQFVAQPSGHAAPLHSA